MSMFELIRDEIQEVRRRDLSVARIRVTPATVQGSIVTVPVDPDEAPMMTGLGILGIIDNPDRLREVLIHPRDWAALLLEKDDETGEYLVGRGTGGTTIFGVEVQ